MFTSSVSRSILGRSLLRQNTVRLARPLPNHVLIFGRTLTTPTARKTIPCPWPSSIRKFSSYPCLLDSKQTAPSLPPLEGSSQEATSIPVNGERTPIGQIEQRLSITFTCSVDNCGHRSSHEFTKRSYTHGIVLVQCPGCKNRHLIADNLSWFTETADEPKTIEEMIKAKGGKVRRGVGYSNGQASETIEIEGEQFSN